MAQLTSEQLLTLLPETRSLLRAALGGAGDAPLNPGVSPVAEVLDGGGALRFPGLSARLALTLYDAHAEWASGLSDLEADQGFDATVRLYGLALAARAGGASPAEAAAWLRSPEGQRTSRHGAEDRHEHKLHTIHAGQWRRSRCGGGVRRHRCVVHRRRAR